MGACWHRGDAAASTETGSNPIHGDSLFDLEGKKKKRKTNKAHPVEGMGGRGRPISFRIRERKALMAKERVV